MGNITPPVLSYTTNPAAFASLIGTEQKFVLVILPHKPTFDSAAAVAYIQHNRPEYRVVVHFDVAGTTAQEVETATALGWEVLDLLGYDQDKYGTRTMMAASELKFWKKVMDDDHALQMARDLRANNGCDPEDAKNQLGGFLKSRYPFSIVGLIRDVWNCLDELRLSREQVFEAMLDVAWTTLQSTVPEMRGKSEQVATAVKVFLTADQDGRGPLFRENQGRKDPHPFSLQGYILESLRIGREFADVQAQAKAWCTYFRVTARTAPNPQDWKSLVETDFRFGGKENDRHLGRLVHTTDDRQLKSCWQAMEAGGEKPVLIIWRDLRTSQLGLRWTHGDLIINGGASRIRRKSVLTDDQMITVVRGGAGTSVGKREGSLELLYFRLNKAEEDTWHFDARHRKVFANKGQEKASESKSTPTTPKLREFTTPPQRNLDTKPVRVEVIEGPVATPDVVVPMPPTRTDGGRSRNRAGRLTADQLAARRQGSKSDGE